jgi:hypothetical protein
MHRHAVSSNGALATELAGRLAVGEDLDLCSDDTRLAETTREDVRRVAERYFAEGEYGVIVAGRTRDVVPRLVDLGLGPPSFRDGFTRDRAP